MHARSLLCLAAAAAALAFGACRGGTSTSPPVHPVLDMDFQPKVKAQSMSKFDGFADHRGQRLPVRDGLGKTAVVARGSLENPALGNRNPADNTFVTEIPLALTEKVLARGRERFDIHCAVCHGYSGRGGNGPTGHGIAARRMTIAIPSFHVVEGKDNRVANLPAGEIFEVITHGKGTTMPAYGPRISVEDRWAIVHYVRALQTLGRQ